MKFFFKIILFFFLGINFVSRSCNPLNVPTLLNQTVASNSLILNFQTNSTQGSAICPDIIEVEIACGNNPFTGTTSCALFTTPTFTYLTVLTNYPTFGINIINFCPGPYKFRFRERNANVLPTNITASPWSSTYNFTVPGGFTPPSVYITSSNPSICPPQSTQLTANMANMDCGVCPVTYSWAAPPLSCITCSNPMVSPTVTTTYTVWVTGGQLGCWTASNTITIPIGPIPPVIGNVIAPATCNGSTSTVGLDFYVGAINWMTGPTANGPWTFMNIGNYSFLTPTLSVGSYYYRAFVTGCQMSDTSAVGVVNVFPNPTVTVTSPIICPGETATITASGANTYQWSTGSFPSGANTGGAAPLITTQYTVSGTSGVCTATALSTVTVDTMPVAVVNNQTVCANQNLTLSAGGGVTYEWKGPLNFSSTLQNPIIANALPIHSGDYTVTAISIAGCTNSTTSNVTVLSLISPTLLISSPVCYGTNTSFTALGAQAYTLTGPNGYNTYNPTPVINNISYAHTGTYTLQASIGACAGVLTTFVNVQVPPAPLAFNSSPVCEGLPVTFTASGAASYTWSGPSGFTSQSQHPVIPIMYLNNAGSYTVDAKAANNCITRVTTNVVVNPVPGVPSSDFLVCLNSPINLVSGGGTSYTWKGPQNFTSNAQNPVIPNANYPLSGAYHVSVTTAAGCSNTAVSNVTVINIPTPVITGPSSVCAGSTLNLSGSGGVTYTWTAPNGYSVAGQNPAFNNIGLSATGLFTVVTLAGNCTGVTTTSITVVDLPVFAINTTSVCDANKLQLVPTGGSSYEWFAPNGVNTQSSTYEVPMVTSANGGVYTVVTIGTGGCKRVSSFSLAVLPNPFLAASGATVCAGMPATLTSTGGVSYQWNGPNFSSTDANVLIPSVNSSNTGDYGITVAGVNSCTTAVKVRLDMIALPVPSVIVTPTVCFNSTVKLEAFGGDSYSWIGPYTFVASGQTTTFVANSMGLSGNYTLNATDMKSGCVGRATADILIHAIPEGSLSSNNQKHCVPFCSEFAFVNKHNTPVLSTNWSINGQSYPTPVFGYCFTNPGDYYVTGSFGDANGCNNTTSFLINAHETPFADFLYSPEFPAETADEVVFKNNSTGNDITKFSWSFLNNAGFKSSSENTSFYFNEAANYPVSFIVKNKWDCADTAIKSIVVSEDFMIFVPNSFTPNDDGQNEIFQPKGRGVVKYRFMIHDRWGERVFETNDFSQGWDGTFRGKACKEDSYQWKIYAVDKSGKVKDLWGHVNLYR